MKLRECRCSTLTEWRLLIIIKEPFVSLSVYWQILLSKCSFKRLIFTLLKQLNTNMQEMFLPPYSCLQ